MFQNPFGNQNNLLGDHNQSSPYKNLSIDASDYHHTNPNSGSLLLPTIHIMNNSITSAKNENFQRLVEIENHINKGFLYYIILIWVILVRYSSK